MYEDHILSYLLEDFFLNSDLQYITLIKSMVAYNKHDPFQCKINHNYTNYIDSFDLCAWYKSSLSLNMVSFIIYIVFTEDKQKEYCRIILKQSFFPT